MLGDIKSPPASTRPKYGLEAQPDTDAGSDWNRRLDNSITANPVKKAALLVLLAAASSLLLVIPDNDAELYGLEASSESQGGADDLVIDDADDVDDAEALAAPVREVAAETGVSSEADTARLALATEAALAGAEHSLAEGSAIRSFVDEMDAVRAAAAAFATTTSTAAPTTAKPAPTTTAKPATSAADSSATSEDSSTTSGTETSTTDPGTETTSSETTTPDTTNPDGSTSEPPTSDTTTPETTVPDTTAETTAPPTTAEAGWVDTGNGVMVPPVLLAIRYCESTDNYTAANPSSSARGAYQFLTGSWAGYGHKDRYGVNQAHLATPAQQDEAALITWQRDGTRPWNASRSCWSSRI